MPRVVDACPLLIACCLLDVRRAGRQFELLATNELPDGVFAAPVISDGWIYLRTLRHFYYLGEKERT